jgi:hypothetical protein
VRSRSLSPCWPWAAIPISCSTQRCDDGTVWRECTKCDALLDECTVEARDEGGRVLRECTHDGASSFDNPDRERCLSEVQAAAADHCGTAPFDAGMADAGSCTTPVVFHCGTSSAGTIPCASGQVCCLWPGCDPTAANPYTANGAESRCVAPGTSQPTFDRCPSPAVQLCATSADCSAGFSCDPVAFYCVGSSTPACRARGDTCTGDVDCCSGLCCGDFMGCC